MYVKRNSTLNIYPNHSLDMMWVLDVILCSLKSISRLYNTTYLTEVKQTL